MCPLHSGSVIAPARPIFPDPCGCVRRVAAIRFPVRSRYLHEFPRIPGQGTVRAVRHRRAAGQGRQLARSRPSKPPRRSAARNGWSRRRSMPAAAARPAASSSAKSFDDVKCRRRRACSARSMETYQSAGRALPVNLVLVTDADRHRQGAVSVDPGRSRQQGGLVHRLAARRRRHRAGRQARRPKTSTPSKSTSSKACSRTSAASSASTWASTASRPTS